MALRFEIKQSSENQEWFWQLFDAGNNKQLGWSGETYKERTHCEEMVNKIIREAGSAQKP